jgi:hypothetical protein
MSGDAHRIAPSSLDDGDLIHLDHLVKKEALALSRGGGAAQVEVHSVILARRPLS